MKNPIRILLAAAVLTSAAATGAAVASESKLPSPAISEELTIERKFVDVLDSQMSYLEQGTGDVVLFVHGNPTSAYLWRNIIPHVSDTHRAIAVDLIGMGRSGKPDLDYTFDDHARYLDAFVDEMGLTEFTIVGHDWGAALSWNYARLNSDKIVKLAFMEGVLPPAFPMASFEAMGEEFGGLFRALRDPEIGHDMVMVKNGFVEQLLPQLVNRPLGEQAMAEYRAPYAEQDDRLPTWMWPRELPIGGEPARNADVMTQIQAFMGETDMPVLLAYADPGAIVPPQAVPFYTNLIRNVETVFIGQGLHFIQEDQPEAIGRALSDWLRRTATPQG